MEFSALCATPRSQRFAFSGIDIFPHTQHSMKF